MNDRPNPLLLGSAVLYFAAALPLLFAPDELLAYAGVAPSILDAALLQVIGSAIFGFSMLNWMNRFGVIGGIYGRPVVTANFAHAGTAALLLGHIARRVPFSIPLVAVVVAYGVLAVAFGTRLFTAPTS
ncbi:MAG TPA: hypothetical protein VGS22_02585 [Thermoanaerobaculia bacterium]|jgi:hypothetical protein|nr:hypothetical protein [Thermoanaerobaculia bacterium]